LSSERLERIGKTVQRDIGDKRIAGAVTLVIRHGQVAWFRAQGMSDREASKPMRTDSIFRICSMTKPITSVAAMIRNFSSIIPSQTTFRNSRILRSS
jgi:CubicO group peptidase (beta-lactamase class C family)